MDKQEGKTASIPGLAEISRGYMKDFVAEIQEILHEIEMTLVNLEMEPANQAHLQAIYCSLHTIRGLTGLLEETASNRVAIASEELVETLRKYATTVGPVAINLMIQSVAFIRRICSAPDVMNDSKFSGEIDQHISNVRQLKEDILLEARQPLEKETRIGEILIQEGTMDKAEVEDILRKQHDTDGRMKFGELVLREKKVEASDIIRAIRMQKIRSTGGAEQYVRIPLERLDQIIGIVDGVSGIYDTIQDEAVLRFGSNDVFTQESSKAHHLVGDVRRILRALRMVTLQQSFQKLTRTACSIIEENQQEIMFATMGESVELDKDVADKLVLPLAALVRMILEEGTQQHVEGEDGLHSIEVVAYEETGDIRIDLTADMKMDVVPFKQHREYADVIARISSLKGRLTFDDMSGEGLRVRISIPRL